MGFSFPSLGGSPPGQQEQQALRAHLTVIRCTRWGAEECPAAPTDHEGETSCSPLDGTQGQQSSQLPVFIYSIQSCLAPVSDDNEMAPVLVATNSGSCGAGPEMSLYPGKECMPLEDHGMGRARHKISAKCTN